MAIRALESNKHVVNEENIKVAIEQIVKTHGKDHEFFDTQTRQISHSRRVLGGVDLLCDFKNELEVKADVVQNKYIEEEAKEY